MKPDQITSEIEVLKAQILQLLQSPGFPFDDNLRGILPEHPGVYRIFDGREPAKTVLLGRADIEGQGLRQKICRNLWTGILDGYLLPVKLPTEGVGARWDRILSWGILPAQLVATGICPDRSAAQKHIHDHFRVQFMILCESTLRARVASLMLSTLNPAY
jgi:hypothetical protein